MTGGQHLLRLFNDVLDLTKVEAEMMNFHPESIELEKIAREACDMLRALAAKKHITITTVIPVELNRAVLDPGKLRQVFYNFLSNALKFTPEHGRITVRVATQGTTMFRVEVEDTGIGIKPADLGKLFVDFQQLDSSLTKQCQGTGLGLALTKKIAEAQGGSVGVNSVLGKGSTFFAILPRAHQVTANLPTTPGTAKPPINDAPATVPRAREERLSDDTCLVQTISNDDIEPTLTLSNILVVDDSDVNRKYLRILLGLEGHTVIEAKDGLEALELLNREKIDGVISDIMMPRMDGYRLCYEIRKNPALSLIPFIAYSTSFTSPADEKVGLGFGADRFVRKPAAPEAIISALYEAAKTRADAARQFVEGDQLSSFTEYSEALVHKLEEKNSELSQANEALKERVVLAEFSAQVSSALSHRGTLRELLQLCAAAMVQHLDAAFARIWTLNTSEHMLELQASAGLYTHIDGGHRRVPVGQFKIGLIASERKPHLTNSVIGDPRVPEQEWAAREGMVAFAGYPLVVEDRLVGVMAMFARKPLSQNSLSALESVAKAVAAGVERKASEEKLRQSEERFRELAENINEVFFSTSADGGELHYLSSAFEQIFGRKKETLYQNPRAWLDAVHPDDRSQIEQSYARSPESFDAEYRIIRPDGQLRWIHARSFPVNNEAGELVRRVGIAEDITERKHAEREAQRNLKRIQALHEIALAITSTLDLRTQLIVLLEKLELFVPIAAASAVRLFDLKTGTLEAVACRGLDEEKWKAQTRVTLCGRAETVVQSRAPVMVRDVRTDARTYNGEIFEEKGLVSYLGVPLLAHENVLGVLNLYTNQEHVFVDEEIEFITTLAGQAAVAIQHATLYQETQKQKLILHEQERIQRVLKELSQDIMRMESDALLRKVTHTIQEVFKVDVADVRFLDGGKWNNIVVASHNLFQRLPEGDKMPQGATGWVVNHRKSLAIEDYHLRPEFTPGRVATTFGARGYLGTPLLSRTGEVMGAIRALSKQPRNFTAQEIDLFEQFAHGIAIAIQNEKLYRALTKSDKIKSEFLSVMSHELRTPLNIIMGYTALLKDDLADEPSRLEDFENIEYQANEMLAMLDNIMQVIDFDAGNCAVHKKSFDFGRLWRELQTRNPAPIGKEIVFDWQCQENLPNISTDAEKLKQILQNLICNAVKFTERGTVTVSARLKRDFEFQISDTGIGIAANNLAVIFDKFRQVDSSNTREYGGTGLGLYLVKKYTELLGGVITVQSELGKGSTFTLRIPNEVAGSADHP